MTDTLSGHIIGGPVDADYDGAVLTADLAVGDTVLHVDDPADFDEDAALRGGALMLGLELDADGEPDPSTGTTLVYSTYDDDTSTVTLAAPSTVTASSGDRVYIQDPVSGGPVGRLEVMVALDDGDSTGDAIPAWLDVAQLGSVGVVDLTDLAVEVDEDEDGQLYVSGFPGLVSRQGAVKFMQDQTTATGSGGSQTLFLTYRPVKNSEHLYWNGLYQPGSEWSRDQWTVTIPDPSGAMEAGDILAMEYAYTDPTIYTPPPPSALFIGATSAALASISSLDLPAGTQPGDMLVLGGVHGFFGGSNAVTTLDPRMTITYQTLEDGPTHWHAMCAYGFATDSTDPVSLFAEDGAGDAVALLATYRVQGSRRLLSDVGETGPCSPPMPTPADLGIMLVAAGVNPGGGGLDHDFHDNWIRDSRANSASQCVTTWSCPTGTPPALLVQADGSDISLWAYLTMGFS